jgi:nitrogen fixation NifU-like protein
MSAALHQLYQQVILDHNRHPRNDRVIEGAQSAERYNPMCGDRITVYLLVDGDAIRDAAFRASGCAIVKACASLMTESLKGRTLVEATALGDRFHRLVSAPPGAATEDLGVLTALVGVRQFPTRIKCALLPWQALAAAAGARGDTGSI